MPAVNVPLVLTFVTLVLPNWMELLLEAIARYPIAVAFVKLLVPTFASKPIAVL